MMMARSWISLNKFISLSPDHWMCVFTEISPKNKRFLKGYFSSIYPRSYIKKLLAFLEANNDFQSKET